MSKQPLSSLSAIPLKGSAARPEPIPDVPGEGRAVSEPPPAPLAPPGARAGAPAQPSGPARLPLLVQPPAEDPRSTLTVRLRVGTQERLREMAHRTRRQKQDLVEEALVAFMDQYGF
jgi:hypothetical protein